jgi:ATP-dependent DNA helicase RecQ
MLALCELTSCRRRALLAYFGERLAQPCGNCDVCLQPPKTWDATVAAQQALSCVYRTGQRFGVNYVIDVLVGREDPRIQANRHDRISTFAIGAAFKSSQWRHILRQLIAQGFLDVDADGHGAVRLTEASRPLLRGEINLQLRELPARDAARKAEKRTAPVADLDAADQLLFEALRQRRMELAREQEVPPYVIFHDSTLRELASRRPRTDDQMREISGIGEQKLARFGKDFMAVIQAQTD